METAYKAMFLLIFAGLIATVVGVARTLKQRPEARANQIEHELRVLKIVRPVLGLVFYLALFDWLLPGTRLSWAALQLPAAVRWTGAGGAVAAILLLRWSFTTLGRNYRGGVGLWDDHELVLTGPYRWVQHPIYVAFVLAMIGTCALSANWLIGVSGIALTLSIPALRLPVEEGELAERFGDRYRNYRRTTARFVPRVF